MTNRATRFWQNSLRTIPSEDRSSFLNEAYFTNYFRVKIFAVAIFTIQAFVVIIDLQRLANGLWEMNEGYRYLFYLHLLLEAVLLIFIILTTLRKPDGPPSIRVSHMVTVLLFIIFIMIWAAAVATVAQTIHGLITVYVIAIFGVAVAFYVSGAMSLLMYLVAQAVFLFGVSQAQSNPEILVGHYLSSTALVVVAWIISRLVFSSRVKEYLDNRTIEKQKFEIEAAKEESDTILKNILPESIVSQINGLGYPQPRYNSSTTIVFADFVSFYRIVETSDALKVLKILERLFNSFDDIVRSHNLEKLKTIGDCYMYAGGLFTDDNQLDASIEAAFEMREIVRESSEQLRSRTGRDWALRIGLHTGPAITGIIGTWRFIFDVWGPTVNIASRLEAASMTNKINVSRAVYEHLKKSGKYDLEPRGALAIKDMEPVEMFFVERKGESQPTP